MISGNDSQSAQAIYQNLYSHYLAAIPVDRTEIHWSGPIWIGLYGGTLIVFFYLLSTHLRHAGVRGNRVLELTSFGGELTEQVGKLALFSYLVWGFVLVWAGYFAVGQMLFGLIY